MIKEDYVSFELAKLLDEKGFDIVTNCSYYIGSSDEYVCKYGDLIGHPAFKYDKFISAPTHQRAMKWLREVHKILIQIWILSDYGYWFNIEKLSDNYNHKELYSIGLEDKYYSTYEEAVEAALKYVLEYLI